MFVEALLALELAVETGVDQDAAQLHGRTHGIAHRGLQTAEIVLVAVDLVLAVVREREDGARIQMEDPQQSERRQQRQAEGIGTHTDVVALPVHVHRLTHEEQFGLDGHDRRIDAHDDARLPTEFVADPGVGRSGRVIGQIDTRRQTVFEKFLGRSSGRGRQRQQRGKDEFTHDYLFFLSLFRFRFGTKPTRDSRCRPSRRAVRNARRRQCG